MPRFKFISHDTGKAIGWLALVCTVVLSAIMMFPSAGFADEGDDEAKYSFYKTASAAAVYFDEHATTAASEAADGGSGGEDPAGGGAPAATNDKDWKEGKVPFYRAGGLLGFADPDYDTIFFGTFSRFTGAQTSVSYSSLSNIEEPTSTGLVSYAMYGKALSAVGVDDVPKAGLEDTFGSFGRIFTGILLFVGFMIASASDFLFWALIKLLKYLNPFYWFGGVFEGVTETGDAPGHFFKAIAEAFFGDASGTFLPMNMIIAAILIGVAIFTTLMTLAFGGSTDLRKKFKLLIFRLAFIFVGVPLLCGAYTNAIDMLDRTFFSGSDGYWSNSSRILFSTVVDFKDWASSTNLELPSGVNLATNYDGSMNWGESSTPHFIATRINQLTYSKGDVNNNLNDGSWGSQVANGMNLILSMMTGDGYTENDYETSYKGLIESATNAGDSELQKNFFDNLQKTQTKDGYREADQGEGYFSINYNPGAVDEDKQFLYITGGNMADPEGGTGIDMSRTFKGQGNTNITSSVQNPKDQKGLSPLSVYNYLVTKFDSDSLLIFSSQKVLSGSTRVTHKAVNIVGESPIHKGLNAILATVQFLAIGIVGIFYGLRMFFEVIKQSFKMVVSIPIAQLGFTRFMVKVLVQFVMLLGVILVTVLLYELLSELLLMINDLFAGKLLMELVSGAASSAATGNNVGKVYDPLSKTFISADSVNSVINWGAGVPSALIVDGGISPQVINGTYMLFSALGTIIIIILDGAFCVFAMSIWSAVIKSITGSLTQMMESFCARHLSPSPDGGSSSTIAAPAAGGGGSVTDPGVGSASGALGGLAAGVAGAPMVAGNFSAAAGQMMGNAARSEMSPQMASAVSKAGGMGALAGATPAGALAMMGSAALKSKAKSALGGKKSGGGIENDGAHSTEHALTGAVSPESGEHLVSAGGDDPIAALPASGPDLTQTEGGIAEAAKIENQVSPELNGQDPKGGEGASAENSSEADGNSQTHGVGANHENDSRAQVGVDAGSASSEAGGSEGATMKAAMANEDAADLSATTEPEGAPETSAKAELGGQEASSVNGSVTGGAISTSSAGGNSSSDALGGEGISKSEGAPSTYAEGGDSGESIAEAAAADGASADGAVAVDGTSSEVESGNEHGLDRGDAQASAEAKLMANGDTKDNGSDELRQPAAADLGAEAEGGERSLKANAQGDGKGDTRSVASASNDTNDEQRRANQVDSDKRGARTPVMTPGSSGGGVKTLKTLSGGKGGAAQVRVVSKGTITKRGGSVNRSQPNPSVQVVQGSAPAQKSAAQQAARESSRHLTQEGYAVGATSHSSSRDLPRSDGRDNIF